jgi:uncharacterized protein (DUF1015 family)
MAQIAPFQGWTYDFERLGDPASLLAPPYDVISPEEQETLYAASPYNVIRLILGRKKTGDSDWDNRYTRTAETLERWIAADVLVRSPVPAFYVTSMTYDPGDGSGAKTRWGLIGLVRIADEDSPVILPHERTFSAHKDDRLRLMRATGAQFSQIFALYEDPAGAVLGCFREFLERPPNLAFDGPDRSSHRMWVVRDRTVFPAAAAALKDRSLLIADGHHRYETARSYRNLMRARHGHRPSDRTHEFTMMYLSNMADPGLSILPSHRLIRFLGDERENGFPGNLDRWFEVSPLPWGLSESPDRAAALRELIGRSGRDTVTFAHFRRGHDEGLLLRLRPGAEQDMGEDLHPCLRKLDVLVLSRLIFQRSLGYTLEALDNEERFFYESDMGCALHTVASGACEMGFFLEPTRIEQVRQVASNRLVMPRKSTYFHPKVLSGLVFNRMNPHELVQIP